MKRIGVMLLLALSMLGARADDFGLWTGIGFGQNLGVKGLDADFDLGFRSNNSVRNVDRWSAGFGLNYAVCRYLKVGASYTYMYGYSGAERKENYKSDNVTWEGYNLTHAYWRSKNRFSFDLKTGVDVGRFTFSLRERYQLTGYNSAGVVKEKYRYKKPIPVYDENGNFVENFYPNQEGYPQTVGDRKEHKTKEYLRSKLEASYNIRHCPLEPSVSVELENNLREGFKLDEVRYVAGLDWKISKKVRLGASYHFNCGHDADANDNLHAIEVSLKFKNLFGGVKKK